MTVGVAVVFAVDVVVAVSVADAVTLAVAVPVAVGTLVTLAVWVGLFGAMEVGVDWSGVVVNRWVRPGSGVLVGGSVGEGVKVALGAVAQPVRIGVGIGPTKPSTGRNCPIDNTKPPTNARPSISTAVDGWRALPQSRIFSLKRNLF